MSEPINTTALRTAWAVNKTSPLAEIVAGNLIKRLCDALDAANTRIEALTTALEQIAKYPGRGSALDTIRTISRRALNKKPENA